MTAEQERIAKLERENQRYQRYLRLIVHDTYMKTDEFFYLIGKIREKAEQALRYK